MIARIGRFGVRAVALVLACVLVAAVVYVVRANIAERDRLRSAVKDRDAQIDGLRHAVDALSNQVRALGEEPIVVPVPATVPAPPPRPSPQPHHTTPVTAPRRLSPSQTSTATITRHHKHARHQRARPTRKTP